MCHDEKLEVGVADKTFFFIPAFANFSSTPASSAILLFPPVTPTTTPIISYFFFVVALPPFSFSSEVSLDLGEDKDHMRGGSRRYHRKKEEKEGG